MNLIVDMLREKILVLTLFSIYCLSSAAGQNKSFSALFAFGDSILDTGNNNRLLTLLKGNFWPYGWNYDYKIPTGRFGNGRVFTDMVGRISHSFYGLLIFIFTEKINVFYLFLFSYLILYIENTLWRKLYFHVVKSSDIAQELGVKRVVPAYRRMRRIKPGDLKTGVCFASGGSGIDHLTSRTLVKRKTTNLLIISLNTIIYLDPYFLINIFFPWMVVCCCLVREFCPQATK